MIHTVEPDTAKQIAGEIPKHFRCFGAGSVISGHPLSHATKDSPSIFALGVDVATVVDFVLRRAKELSNNGKPKRVRKVTAPKVDGNRTERILHRLDILFTLRTDRTRTLSTAEIDTLLKSAGPFGFIASTSTQISRLRKWYESQGIGTIRRIEERKNGVRICRYFLEKAKT